MQTMMLKTAWVLIGIVAMSSMAFGLDAKDAVRLKKAGVSDQTLEVMAKEKTIETAAFTVDEILAMKAAGIGEGTLQTILAEGSFLKDREPIVYGKDLRSIRFTTAADIIELKKAGVSDDVLQAIVAASRRDSDVDRDAALNLLRDMGIWVDVRR
ncbi:MAG: hypothetical protein HY895_09635 [Deltaproteobacteria bacterium]|nr:hypothetical protein [Deltaproteobacteria bacterium]